MISGLKKTRGWFCSVSEFFFIWTVLCFVWTGKQLIISKQSHKFYDRPKNMIGTTSIHICSQNDLLNMCEFNYNSFDLIRLHLTTRETHEKNTMRSPFIFFVQVSDEYLVFNVFEVLWPPSICLNAKKFSV